MRLINDSCSVETEFLIAPCNYLGARQSPHRSKRRLIRVKVSEANKTRAVGEIAL